MKNASASMSLRRYPVAIIVFLALFGLVSLGQAQITLDGSLGPSGALSGPNFLIPADVGQTRGGNLFHSFGKFNVLSGESATFTGPSSIANIIGRVTGGQQSAINGILRSDIAGANLYLLNPAGVFFGPNAKLEVSGSFHASTGDYLRFADGAKFYADLARQSVLTSAPISAFGFLSSNPAGISIQGNTLQTVEGQTLSVIGGTIEITNSLISAPGGRINLASVASPGEVTPITTPSAPDLGLGGFSRLGDAKIFGSTLSTSGQTLATDPAGIIVIRGGQILVQNSALNAIGNPGGLLSIGGERLDLDRTFVNTGTRGVANHPGTAVDIDVSGVVSLHNGSEIASSSLAAGNAGGIRIEAGSVLLGDDDPTTSPFASTGFYGDIGSRAFASGRGGNVEITAQSLTIKNGFFINTAAQSGGDAGNVTVRAGELSILDGASVSSNGFGLGRGGIVTIEVGDALISARNINSVPNCACFTGVAAQAGFGSPGGAIRIKADTLRLIDGGRVSTALFSIGPGADIEITAKQLVISGVVLQKTASPSDVHASIDARVSGSFASGRGGNIRVIAGTVEVTDGGFISSSLFNGAPGRAGDTNIEADRINISNRGVIAASSVFGSGLAGAINITADSLTITGIAGSTDPFSADFTGLSTLAGALGGRGGNIQLNLGSLEMTDKATINSGSLGSGNAGNINIQLSGDLRLSDEAKIVATTFGLGNGGTINLQISGDLSVTSGGAIISSAFGSGNGGTIDVTAKSVTVTGVVDSLVDAGISGIASQAGTNGGSAGAIRITTGQLEVLDGAVITAETFGPGNGGNIGLTADRIVLRNGASVSSKSSGSGNAGDIAVKSKEFLSVKSSVTTAAETADGGNIDFMVGSIMELVDSKISAEVKSGVGSGGNIIISDPTYVILNDSQITANAFGGSGGNITIVSDMFLASPESSVTASSALSTQGTVDIRAAIIDLKGALAPLPENMLQAASLMNQSCATRFAGGRVNTLALATRGALPWEPGALMPSPLYRMESKTAALPQNSFAAEHPEIFARLSSAPKPAFSINGACSK